MRELILIIIEQFKNIPKIYKLAIYSMKKEYANHYLGVFWNIIQPLLQLSVYYVVFGLGLRGGGNSMVVGVPFIIHLISGLFPWLFLSQGINAGANAIMGNMSLLSKMKFPSSVFISISLTNNVINLVITSSILFVISVWNGYVPYWHYLYFLYFLMASVVLIFGISLIMSTLVIIVRDTKNLLQNIIRMLFFMTPIFWAMEEAQGILKHIVSLNPLGYLVGIYRLAFVHGSANTYGEWHDHVYFWIFTLIVLLIGAIVHTHFKKKLLDYL